MALNLEGDGLLESIYHYIWLKDIRDDGSRGFSIPDTVIYKYQQPRSWYFTSLDGSIKKKAKDKLNSHTIENSFLKRPSDTGIIACYMFISPTGSRVAEFFGAEELKHFLHYRKKTQDGILQRFIDPKGNHNSLLQVVWSPKICLFEYRENLKDLYDLRYDLYERAITFEGEEFHSTNIPIRGKELKTFLGNISNNIKEHIHSVTSGRINISRMVLHFKLDKNDKLWFLRATSIRCASERGNQPLDLNVSTNLPETVNSKKYTINPQNPATMQKTVLCRNCEKPNEPDAMFEVSYRFVIEAHIGYGVPALILKINPRLSPPDYEKYKKNPLFMNKQALICDACYLEYTKFADTGGAQSRPESCKSLGSVRQLDPLKITRRREMTQLNRGPHSSSHKSAIRNKSVYGEVQFSGASGELLAMPNYKRSFPRIPRLDLDKHGLIKNLQNQKNLSKLLGMPDITSFLEERMQNKRSKDDQI
jgi:hypothetical protein